MKQIYLFSGLGADERVFQFLDFNGYQATFIKWITVESTDTLESYTRRLLEQVTTPYPTLVGMSFGGMIAIEAAKRIKTEKIVIIASVKTRKELPPYFKWSFLTPLINIIPAKMLLMQNFLINWLFGIKSKADEKIFMAILKDTDPVLLKWAMKIISSWQNQSIPENIVHIHGTKDKIFPMKYLNCDAKVDNGGHFMAVSSSTEVSVLLRNAID